MHRRGVIVFEKGQDNKTLKINVFWGHMGSDVNVHVLNSLPAQCWVILHTFFVLFVVFVLFFRYTFSKIILACPDLA